MRSSWISPLGGDVIRAIALVCLADGVVGLSYGSLATASGFPLWVPMTLSLLVMAGASEFLFVSIVAGGGSPFAGAAAGLLVNARHLPFGMAVNELIGKNNQASQLFGCHIMNDESVVFGISQKSPAKARIAYWLCGLGIAVCWPVSVLIGGSLGKFIPDINVIGLDAVFPAIIMALTVSALRQRQTLRRALSGMLISLAAVPWLPTGLPVLFSLLGLAAWRRNK
ncbi:AzlC family ABC transporter permease [Rouxiella sp. WC2420]|uniref:AzlC family ABC transporter permease n=1 Tax=Rouxiella sp. WC2420 TaxID=3234145 RepID=A0AB39VMW2_9GAMM